MKKLLFSLLGIGFSISCIAQSRTMEITETTPLSKLSMTSAQFKKPVNDTILPPLGNCPNPFTTISIGGNIITGTFELSNGDVITDVGQVLNVNGDPLDIYSLLVFTVYKDEGPTKGSFTAALYDTTNGIGSTPLTTSNPVGFDNVNDTNGISSLFDLITEFTFPTPYSVNAPFWATVQVDNGSDTISIASTPNNCGVGSIMNLSDTAWVNYSSVFTSNGNPIQLSVHIWASVEDQSVGLDRNFISRSGLNFYPNPARENATVEFDLPNENKLTLLIQDMSGREVYRTEQSFNAGDREFRLDLSSFEAGAYTYQVIGEKSQLNGVFIKE